MVSRPTQTALLLSHGLLIVALKRQQYKPVIIAAADHQVGDLSIYI
jgi:hypothetical protein